MAVFSDASSATWFSRNDPLVGSEIVGSVSVKLWSTVRYS
jgi:hypothetical protein